MRSLAPEEAELWARVTATIRPLSRKIQAPDVARPGQEDAPPVTPSAGPRQRAIVARSPSPVPVSQRTLDGSWDRMLGSGRVVPDRVIDLHGMNLDRAWHAIDTGLDQAITSGQRVILLITGHHRSGEPPIQRGKIRAAVHDWLAASRHAARIAAVRGAHPRHGGGGSLYLILKR